MSRVPIAAFALVIALFGMADCPVHAQVVPNGGWFWGEPQPQDFPNSWGWDWGHPVGSIYGPGPYGGFGYFNPYGVYNYTYKNPVKVTGEFYGWLNPWY
jgi:hypothetical protein